MTLEEYCNSINENMLASIAIECCEAALINWEKFCKNHKTEYKDSVTSVNHSVRQDLLRDTIMEAKQIQKYESSPPNGFLFKMQNLQKEFREHIVSLQDWDWHLPYETEKTFYSVYNLAKGFTDKKTNSETLSHYISINQAIEAIEEGKLMTENEIRKILYERK